MPWLFRAPERNGNMVAPPNKNELIERCKGSVDVWDIIWYLFTRRGVGEQAFLCNKLLSVEEAQVELYLSQLCYLIAVLKSEALDRALCVLCEKSLRIAVKAYWLLNAAVEDRREQHLVQLRDACERAGLLEGTWHLPFDDEQQMPLSPPRAPPDRSLFSPPNSPTFRPPVREAFSPRGGLAQSRCMSPDPFLERQTRTTDDFLSPGGSSRPTSPTASMHNFIVDAAVDGIIYPSYPVDEGLEDGIRRRSELLEKQLGKGQGVSSLIERSSREPSGMVQTVCPRDKGGARSVSPLSARTEELRQSTCSMTLDFIERLTKSSTKLARYARDERRDKLLRYLRALNRMIADSARKGASCWFPLGTRNERIVRLALNHAQILNSRDKAPFLLHVEVLQASGDVNKEMEVLFSEEEGGDEDVEEEVLGEQWEEDETGCSPGEDDLDTSQAHSEDQGECSRRDLHLGNAGSSGTASGSLLLSSSPPAGASPSGVSFSDVASPQTHSPAALDINTLSLREDSASPCQGCTPTSPSQKEAAAAEWRNSVRLEPQGRGGREAAPGRGEPGRRSARPRSGGMLGGLLSPSRHRPSYDAEAEQDREHLPRSLRAAASGLRGDGPAVAVDLIVDEGCGQYDDASSGNTSDSPAPPRPQGPGAREMSGSQKEAVVQGSRIIQLLSGWGGNRPPEPPKPREPHVTLVLKVYGGVNLRLPTPPRRSSGHKRISSVEGLGRMEALISSGAALGNVGTPVHSSDLTRHPSGAPRSRTANRSPPTPPGQDRPAPKSSERSKRQRTPLREVANRMGSAPVGSSASLYGSVGAAGGGQGPPAHVFGSMALNRGPRMVMSSAAMEDARKRQRDAEAIYGQTFEELTEQVKAESPFGQRPGWALRQVIVKSGDDCRQELLAVQLIRVFHDIFKRAELPIWVRPFEVLVVSSRTAMIEVVPDAPSVHTIKARGGYSSLAEHFFAKFIRGSQECREAQYRFTESMAGYSLVCYFLAVKDRHNGNILLANDGRLVHIDFGFMLSNAPGNIAFEGAAFKLTRELLEILDSDSDGRGSPMFDYFKVLFLQGFMACRAEAEQLINMVRLMEDTGFPCYRAGRACAERMRKRFFIDRSDTECVELALGLIGTSLDAFSSRQYDYYQKIVNGIW